MDTTHNTLDRVTTIKRLYRVPQTYALLLDLLLINKVTSVQEIVDGGAAPTIETARVVMHKLKKALLNGKSIIVESQNSLGYWLRDEDKKVFENEIHKFNYPEG